MIYFSPVDGAQVSGLLWKLMTKLIDESVSVDLVSNHIKKSVYPWVVGWRGRQYRITKVGLHHTTREGRVLFHIFSVTDGTTLFKLQFDSETLFWKLLEVDSDESISTI